MRSKELAHAGSFNIFIVNKNNKKCKNNENNKL